MRTATDPIIKATGVEKFYGTEVHALKNVSTQVAEGEVVVIVGPSGSGKSTFLRTLNQLETINDGNIVVDGICLTEPGDVNKLRKRWAWCSSPSTSSPPDGTGQHHPRPAEGARPVAP